MILFINACVREKSRTKRLADRFLSKLNGEVKEIKLENADFPKTNEEFLSLRDSLLEKGDFDNKVFDYAKDFAKAEEIVIAAPYWDLSFPAMLKQYLEQICVVGVTFRYNSSGVPISLCKAKRLTYITTAGGEYAPFDFGFEYVKALSGSLFGIKEIKLVKATGLDIEGNDVERILKKEEEEIDNI
ncbi:MAG: NAD(P)H-dependent oxidoreductase [Clostridia bacterium]|nr:NAD(P)H-dependent oxidoreductase [Clostridia bacterium]